MFVTLTTDFGREDAYVGMMKGVMVNIAPQVSFIDLSHDLPPQDVHSAAYLLWSALPYFPSDSVHLVVVDPGVGTSRRPIAARTAWGLLVGPDNGVFSYVWETSPPELMVELSNPRYHRSSVSHTFHGRDIFAPSAAHLAHGVPLSELGSPITDPVRLPRPKLEILEGCIRGEVLYVDHFGNVISSIGRLVWEGEWLRLAPAFGNAPSISFSPSRAQVTVANREVGPIRRTYGEVSPGEELALVGSAGMLEIAVAQGHGAQTLDLRRGELLEIRWK